MIEELVQKLSQKTGLPPDKAEEVVNLVVSHLKDKLPAVLSSALDSHLSGSAGQSGGANNRTV
jgi:hypothetical protein